jgi:hypothetical protein
MSGIIRWALGELGRQVSPPMAGAVDCRAAGVGLADSVVAATSIRAPPVENHGNEGDEHDQTDTQHGEQRDKHAGMPAHGRGRGTTRQG